VQKERKREKGRISLVPRRKSELEEKGGQQPLPNMVGRQKKKKKKKGKRMGTYTLQIKKVRNNGLVVKDYILWGSKGGGGGKKGSTSIPQLKEKEVKMWCSDGGQRGGNKQISFPSRKKQRKQPGGS